MRQSKIVNMLCSIPPDVRAWVKAKAAHGLMPMNAVIVAAVREKMAAEQRQLERAEV